MDARNDDAKQSQSLEFPRADQAHPEPMSTLQFLPREDTAQTANVREMTALWESKVNMQAMCDLMVEVVFPTCAIFLLTDERVRKNKVALSALASGEIYQNKASDAVPLIAGSRAEGLTMHGQWGHPWPDYDAMALIGNRLGVKIPHCQLGTKYQPIENMLHSSLSQGCHSNSCLEYIPEGCPPGYTRLRVRDVQALMDCDPTGDLPNCVEERDGHNWLNTARLNQVAMWDFNEKNPTTQTTGISGPAGQLTTPDGVKNELVLTFVANSPHHAMEEYLKRPRGEWPTKDQLYEIKQLPVTLVLVGSKESQNSDQEARNSWSPAEILLISKLPNYIKQGFIAAKCTFKSAIKHHPTNETADGRSYVSSYHLKTALLYHLEKTPPSQINSPFQLMINVLHDLHMYLKEGTLPHYFLPECNLLATVGHDEWQVALQAIKDICSDPVVAVLRCPSEPNEIYGNNICRNEFMETFRRVCTQPNCKRSRGDLFQLLRKLDEDRLEHYGRRLEADAAVDAEDDCRVSGRPELTGLVDMLQKINDM